MCDVLLPPGVNLRLNIIIIIIIIIAVRGRQTFPC
jgi:hypothetical protein